MNEWLGAIALMFGGPLLALGALWVLAAGLSLLGPLWGLAVFVILVYRFLEAGSE